MNFTTLHQLAAILEGRLLSAPVGADPALAYSENSIDTRTLRPGDIFWALPGTARDGHDFVREAFQRGAAAAIVSRSQDQSAGPCIKVPHVSRALTRLAAWHRQRQDALLIGVTGSVGKTSTRHMLHGVLAERFAGLQSPANFNNRLGVPLSLLKLESRHEFGVLELAASARGEIADLAELVEPEVGLITQIAPAHLDGFGTIENVASAKSELFAALPENGFAVIPEQFAWLPAVKAAVRCPLLTVGTGPNCHVAAREVRHEAGRLRFRVEETTYSLRVPGAHFLNSALLSLAVAREFGLSPVQIQQGLERFQPIPGRCQLRKIGTWTILDDTYNASPVAMQAALTALQQLQVSGPRIAVLGDMLCLGDQAVRHHRKIGQEIARSKIDYLLTYGSAAREFALGAMQAGMSASRIGVFQDLEPLRDILSLWLAPDSAVLLKASRLMRLERLLPLLEQEANSTSTATIPFPGTPLRKAG